MTNEQDAAGQAPGGQDAAGQPEHVVPPAPAGSPPPPLAPAVPLAPPLGSPAGPPPAWPLAPPVAPHLGGVAAPPPPHWAGADAPGAPTPPGAASAGSAGMTPPYANGSAQHPQSAYPQPAPSTPGAYPLSSSAPPAVRSGGRNLAVVLSIVGAMVVLLVIGVAVAVGLILGSTPSTPVAVPSPSPVAPEGGQPAEPGEPSAVPDDDASDAPADPGAGAAIADRLEQKIDEYKRLRDSGELWQSIPDTEFNRTAVSAFLYFLTDMKVATIWGVDAATATEYEQRMAMLEDRLLAQQPLGDDISITLEDKVFTYDGETGEGGYTPK